VQLSGLAPFATGIALITAAILRIVEEEFIEVPMLAVFGMLLLAFASPLLLSKEADFRTN